MGHGIAQTAAAAGFRVVMRDVEKEALARAVQAIERNLEKGIKLGKLTEDASANARHSSFERDSRSGFIHRGRARSS
jgi:3-hydroxyacyl-CoA dehydrogenase